MYDSQRFEMPLSRIQHAHAWVTVPSPINKRVLLQACDNCGVVKSQNTVRKQCHAEPELRIISSALQAIQC